jgi:hypothetical protein
LFRIAVGDNEWMKSGLDVVGAITYKSKIE